MTSFVCLLMQQFDDSQDFTLETEYFYKNFRPENISDARKKKAMIKIKDFSDKDDFDWTCQQVSVLFDIYPSWILETKSIGMNTTKFLFYDQENPDYYFKCKLFPNFKMKVNASLFWIVHEWTSHEKIFKIDHDDRNRPYKKPKKKQLFNYQLNLDIEETSCFIILNAPFAYYYPPELFSDNFNIFCHYLHFEKKIP